MLVSKQACLTNKLTICTWFLLMNQGSLMCVLLKTKNNSHSSLENSKTLCKYVSLNVHESSQKIGFMSQLYNVVQAPFSGELEHRRSLAPSSIPCSRLKLLFIALDGGFCSVDVQRQPFRFPSCSKRPPLLFNNDKETDICVDSCYWLISLTEVGRHEI